MSLRKFRKPRLIDKHEAESVVEKNVGMVEKAADKVKKIIKKVSPKN